MDKKMKSARNHSAIIMAGVLLSGCVTSGNDPSHSMWLAKSGALREARQMAANGMVPVDIQCRAKTRPSGEVYYETRLTWKNLNIKEGRWEVGYKNYMLEQLSKNKQSGYDAVVVKTVYDKRVSGGELKCAIWYKL